MQPSRREHPLAQGRSLSDDLMPKPPFVTAEHGIAGGDQAARNVLMPVQEQHGLRLLERLARWAGDSGFSGFHGQLASWVRMASI